MRCCLVFLPFLLATPAAAQVCEPPAVCVPKAEMNTFVKLLREKQCQLNEAPEFELDPIQVIVDKNGRVFYSGANPKPYKLKMSWCNYEIKAKGKVSLVAAVRQPPIWGFRLRPKAYIGILPSEVFYGSDNPREFGDFVDAGIMIDFLYYDWVNLNGAVGYRSMGVGVGIDLTENFGLVTGYAMTWGWHHNVNLSLSFSF